MKRSPAGASVAAMAGEAPAEILDEPRAAPAQLDRGVRELRVPRVEGGRRRAHADVDELRVPLPQCRLEIARGDRVRRVDGRRVCVDMGAPPRGAALHQEKALGHEDEHLAASTQTRPARDRLDPVPAHALALARLIGDLHRLGAVAEPVEQHR